MNISRRFCVLAAAVILLCGESKSAWGQTYTWSGTNSVAGWGNGANWVGTAIPTFSTSADILFGTAGFGNTTNAIGSARTIRSLTLNSNATSGLTVRLTDTATTSATRILTFNGGGSGATLTVDAAVSGSVTIGVAGTSGTIALADNLTISQNSSSQLIFGRAVSGSGSITKNGSGDLFFQNATDAGTSTFAGGVVVNEGSVGTASAVGFGTGTITLNGGQIRGTQPITITNNVVVSASSTAKTLRNAAANVTWSGNFALNDAVPGNFSIESINTGNLTLGGILSGSGGLTKTGAGSGLLIMNGSNAYTGPTTIATGTLRLGTSSSLASGSITIASGARLDSLVTGGFSLGSGQALGGKGTLAGNANFLNGSILAVDPLTSGTLATTGSLTFGNNFGISNISVPSWNALATGTYTIVAGAQDFTTAGLQNFGFNQKATVSGTQQAYFAASGNNLQLVVVPEPATIALAVGGLVSVGFVGLRRLRRRG